MLSRLRGRADDGGAVAILVVLLVLFLGIPASALGINTYITSSAQADLQQAADAAALAGASSIPLNDLAYTLEYTGATGLLAATDRRAENVLAGLTRRLEAVERRTEQDLPNLPGNVPDDPLSGRLEVVAPLRNACDQAVLAARAMPFNDVYAFRAVNPVPDTVDGLRCTADSGSPVQSPLGVDGFAGAKFYPDASVVGAVADCVGATRRTLELVPRPLGGRVGAALREAQAAVDGLAKVLPALMQPGVIVQARQSVRGPLESLIGARAETDQIVTARARRRVKNLVVVPYDSRLGLDAVGATQDVSEAVKDTLLDTAGVLRTLDAALEGVVVPVPPLPGVPTTGTPLDSVLGRVGGTVDRVEDRLPDEVALPPLPLGDCAAVIDAAVNDYDDAIAPAETSSVTEILTDAATGRQPVIVAVTGPNSTFFDTVPVCLTQPLTPGFAEPLRDTDGNGIPDELTVGATVELQVQPEVLARGVVCAPGTPGAFRASLVR